MEGRINQILKNQVDIMRWIGGGDFTKNYFSLRIKETEEILNPKQETSLKKQIDDALCVEGERE